MSRGSSIDIAHAILGDVPNRIAARRHSLARRLREVALGLITIAFGLLIHLPGSSLGAIAQNVIGDMLYAMMIACWCGALAPSARLAARIAGARGVRVDQSESVVARASHERSARKH